jgi:hypothetical protein
LPSPLAPLSSSPPVGGGSAAAAEGVRHVVDATTRVEILVDTGGAPFRVRATQRLDVRRLGDYFFTIGAPLRDVEAAPGSDATPGLRATSFLWEGFNPKRRLLAARAELEPGAVASSLPLRIELAGGKATLTNTTATTVPTFTADAPREQLLAYLASLRVAAASRITPTGGGTVITSPLRPLRLRISVPLLVDGSIGSARVHVTLGGASRKLRASFAAGPVDVTVRPLLPQELFTASKAASGRALLKQATLASVEFARARQYDAFLGNPDPIGKSATTYVYRSGTPSAPVAAPAAAKKGRDWPRTMLISLGLLALLVAATIAWSRA